MKNVFGTKTLSLSWISVDSELAKKIIALHKTSTPCVYTETGDTVSQYLVSYYEIDAINRVLCATLVRV